MRVYSNWGGLHIITNYKIKITIKILSWKGRKYDKSMINVWLMYG